MGLFIRRSVDSVLDQTFADFELIVVNDGSTDEGHTRIADIEDQRLRIIHQNNQGRGAARNCGMQASKGQLIAFLDADDYWLPCHLEELWALYTTFPNIGLFSTTFIECAPGEKLQLRSTTSNSPRRITNYFERASKNIGVAWTGSTAITRRVYDSVGGFSHDSAGEDLEYWARVSLHFEFAHSDRITCVYQRGTGGIMERISDNTLNCGDAPLLRSITDISPSVRMLINHFSNSSVLQANPPIKKYINSRIQSSILPALIRKDYDYARHLLDFLLPPRNSVQLFVTALLFMPRPIIDYLLTTCRFLLRFSRSLRFCK